MTTARVALSLGSNVEPEQHLCRAMRELSGHFANVRTSTIYRFPAVGFDGPDFLNAAALIDTDMTPPALNDWLHALEDAHGRDRSGPRFGNRPLDIDIVLFGDRVLRGGGHLQVPRDELAHAFVLKPLAEIAPDMRHPLGGVSLADMWRAHPDHAIAFESVECLESKDI